MDGRSASMGRLRSSTVPNGAWASTNLVPGLEFLVEGLRESRRLDDLAYQGIGQDQVAGAMGGELRHDVRAHPVTGVLEVKEVGDGETC